MDTKFYQCPECKKNISVVEWNDYKQELLGGCFEVIIYLEMVYKIYTCPNCKTDLNYYKGIDKLIK